MSRVIKSGVYGFTATEIGDERIAVDDLRELQGHYYKGPATIRLDVSGKHSCAAVDLTPEAVKALIDALDALLP